MTFAEHTAELDRKSNEVIEKHAPVVKWKQKEGRPAWLDKEYEKSRALRRKYERQWRKSRTDENYSNYTQQKKVCIEMALNKQTVYYSKLDEDAGKCQKTLFKVANELLDKK